MESPHITEYILILIAVLAVLIFTLSYDITGNVVGIFIRVAPGILHDLNITFQQNSSVLETLSFSSSYFFSPYNTTIQFNLSIPVNMIINVNMTLIANVSRDIFVMENGYGVSPATAKINSTAYNSTSDIMTVTFKEVNENFTDRNQEVFLVIANKTARINLTIGERKLAVFDQYAISPQNASVVTANFSQNTLRARLSGNGTQEVVIYTGSQPEPTSIVINGSMLPASNWTYSSAEKTVRFNITIFEADIVVNFPTITTTTAPPAIAPSAAPAFGGGAGLFSNFTVEEKLISIYLVQGEEEVTYMTIKNNGDQSLDISISHDMERFLIVSENKILLRPGETKKVKMTIFASRTEKPGVYVGKILLSGGGIKREINVVLEVNEKEPIFDISVSVLPEYKQVEPGNRTRAQIDIENVGLRGNIINAQLSIAMLDFGNRVFYESIENITLIKKLSLIRDIPVPENISSGNYIVKAGVSYGNISSSSFDIFAVIKREIIKPEQVIERIDTRLYNIGIYIIFILISIILFILYEHIRITRIIKFMRVRYHAGHYKRLFRNETKHDKFIKQLDYLKERFKKGMSEEEYIKKLDEIEKEIEWQEKLKRIEEESS